MARFVTTTYPVAGPQERVVKTSPGQGRIFYPPAEPDDQTGKTAPSTAPEDSPM